MNLSQVQDLMRKKKVEFFLCSFVEMSGVPKAKVVTATHLKDMAEGSAGLAGFAAGNIGQGPHSADLIAIPDFSSLMIVPWRKNMAWVASDTQVEGKAWPYCPRTVFKKQIQKARGLGYVLKVGIEPEFFLLRRLENGAYAPYDALDQLAKPCYDLRALTRNLEIITTLLKYMQELGWDPYAGDHEDANCQFEINWLYSDALTTADRHVFFRWMVKTVAEQHGLLATFMPKPFAHLTGTGCHYHMSLWSAGKNRNSAPGGAPLSSSGRAPASPGLTRMRSGAPGWRLASSDASWRSASALTMRRGSSATSPIPIACVRALRAAASAGTRSFCGCGSIGSKTRATRHIGSDCRCSGGISGCSGYSAPKRPSR